MHSSAVHGFYSDYTHLTHETGSVEKWHILFIPQLKAFNLTVNGIRDSFGPTLPCFAPAAVTAQLFESVK